MHLPCVGATTKRLGASIAVAGLAVGSLVAVAPSAGASAATGKTTTVSVKVKCDLGILGSQTLTSKDTSTFPTSVAPKASISGTAVKGSLSVPAALADDAYALGARSAGGQITTFDVNGTDVTPASINGAATPINYGPAVVAEGKPIPIKFPSKGTFTVGKYKATAAGTASFTLGATDGTVNLYTTSNGTGTPLTTIDFSCSTTTTATLGTTTVS